MLRFNPRQQEDVAFLHNTVVNASAGTGKTATLVGAYLSQLAQGSQPGQLLAITFTEKAAAELRVSSRRCWHASRGCPQMMHQRPIGDECSQGFPMLRSQPSMPSAPVFCKKILWRRG